MFKFKLFVCGFFLCFTTSFLNAQGGVVALKMKNKDVLPLFLSPTKYVSTRNFMVDSDWSVFNSLDYTSLVASIYNKEKMNSTFIARNIYSFEKLRDQIEDGDIVHLHTNVLEDFIDQVLEHTDKNVIVILTYSDTIPDTWRERERVFEFLRRGRIIHLFANNVDLQVCPENVSPIPLGLNLSDGFRTKSPYQTILPQTAHQIEKKLNNIIASLLPTTERRRRILIDKMARIENLENKGSFSREEIRDILVEQDVCDVLDHRLAKYTYWQEKGGRAFEVSPFGNNYDCFRTWEGLVLGSIVIVQTSILDPVFEGLPVVIIKDWSEVTPQNLRKWLAKFGDVFHRKDMREKLTHKYWMGKARSVQKHYLSSK